MHFRSAQQSSLAWRMWTVGQDLRLFPQCRKAACIAAYCTQVVRQLVGPVDPAMPAVASLDTYGWDVAIARMYWLPPLWRLYRSPEYFYDHVQDRVSVVSRSVGLHTRRQLQDAFASWRRHRGICPSARGWDRLRNQAPLYPLHGWPGVPCK